MESMHASFVIRVTQEHVVLAPSQGQVALHHDNGDTRVLYANKNIAWTERSIQEPPTPHSPPPALVEPPEPPPKTAKMAASTPKVRAPREPAAKAPPAPPHQAQGETLDASLRRVAELRRGGSFKAALQTLDKAAPLIDSRHAREVVSFERGTLLERVASTSEVCAHWEGHEARFGRSRYGVEIDRVRTRLGCKSTSTQVED